MKYLKRFNEELQPNTYRKAGEKLTKMGHVRRGGELSKWADESQIKLDKAAELETYNELSKYPSFEMEIRKDRWNSSTKSRDFAKDPLIKGNFFLSITFEDDMFNDQYREWLDNSEYGFNMLFMLGIFPADDETRIKFKEVEDQLSEEIWNSMYWTVWFGFKLAENNSHEIKVGGVVWDTRENDTLLFSNRREALKFKRLLSDCFEGKNKFGQGKWYPDGVAEVVKKRFTKSREQEIKDICWIRKDDTPEQIEEKETKADQLLGDKLLTIDNYNDLVKAIKTMSINQMYRH